SQDTKEYFKTTKKGGRYTASVGGAITGFGGNFLIVDDPHNPKQALSDVQRAAANKWYDGTLTSRLNDIKNGAIILIMQRLHESDLTGHLLERGDVEHLKIPNEFEEKTIYHFPISGREIVKTKGEYLHPDRMGKPEADKKKVELGAYNYAGQYQQRPVPLGGGEFKELWYSYYEGELDVRNMNIYIIADPANEKKKDSDYTAITVIGLAPDHNYYLLDMIRDKLNPTERVEAIFQLHRKWNAKGGKPPTVGYEKYGMQSDIHYLNLRQDETNYRFHIAELAGGMAKEDRIRRLIPA
ncbi:hypothetical protein GWN26_06570, partial [Candidatus Saccharibacteria bacterium]|nr:hypothetical protein [Candidatus Saccharibacteria bacterium]NIV03696.1 hypothetical protein [Calditrichia bacterium]NIV72002.1 hypothetical protein [Calditrichia bacterium]NIV98819.1 hypothetical protein [Candidatus Saccharibacteria bacterium]NIW79606.1 hypothetical protein [Calditrichia bacterium]